MDIYTINNLSLSDLFIIGIIGLLLIFSAAIGLEKMIKIIIGNYIIIVLSIGITIGIDILINLIDQGILKVNNPDKIINSLLNTKQIIILTLYFILLLWIFFKSNISINISNNKFFKTILYLILVLLTTINIITTLPIIILGSKILTVNGILDIAENYKDNVIIYKLVLLFPLFLILPGLVIIIISTNISLPKPKFNFKIGQKKNDESKTEEQQSD